MLTVVIPSYNHEKYILDCLNAIKKTTLKDLSLLVIDDGSSDDTAKLVKDFMENNPQLKIRLIEKENKGLVDSLNLAIKEVNTKYVYFCASDDIPIMEGVEKALSYIIDSEADVVITQGYNKFEETGQLTNIYRQSHQRFFEQLPKLSRKEIFENYVHPILLQTSVFKVEAIKEIDAWDKEIKYDDYQLFIKLFLQGKCLLFKEDTYSCYYRHHRSNTYKNLSLLLEMKEEVIERFAPKESRRNLKSKEFAYYFLLAVKNLDIKHILFFISKIKHYELTTFFCQIMVFLNRKIRNKL